MRISLDSETTGLDLRHGCLPFLVTVCYEDGSQDRWEWEVDPLTRNVSVNSDDVYEIQQLIRAADEIVLHNSTFDYTALRRAHPDTVAYWDWSKVRDTLLAGHMLGSNETHNLTDMALRHLKENIEHKEDRLEEAVKKCRALVQQARLKDRRHGERLSKGLPPVKKRKSDPEHSRDPMADWVIAEAGLPSMPSDSKEIWRGDFWLPKAVADHQNLPEGHPYHTLCADYADKDSEVTLALWYVLEDKLRRANLLDNYSDGMGRLKLLPIEWEMEDRGVTVNRRHLVSLREEYRKDRDRLTERCHAIAKSYGYELDFPAGAGRNKSLDTFVFDVLKMPVVKKTKKSGNSALDKQVIETYVATNPEGSKPYDFFISLRDKRSRDTTIGYMEGYERFWLEVRGDWYKLHPQLNPTGTNTLRWSCQNPNEQNIARKGVDALCLSCMGSGGDCKRCYDKKDKVSTGRATYTARSCFGPAPGREWWSLDYQNLELRLPAYAAPEPAMIELFEEPDRPPYKGSYHALVCHILHPQRWEELEREVGPGEVAEAFKSRYKSTWYQWVKNGNFAVQYGAQEYSGTADRAYHVPGAQRMIMSRFTGIKALSDRMIAFAQRHGYVETMPLKGRKRGYPLLCTETAWGKILPTVPLSYHIQGTACEEMQGAMILCWNQLNDWRRRSKGTYDGFITMQVHDELVFDLPKRPHPKTDPEGSNLGRVRVLQRLMESCGDLIGVPTPTSVEYHPENWGEGVAL